MSYFDASYFMGSYFSTGSSTSGGATYPIAMIADPPEPDDAFLIALTL